MIDYTATNKKPKLLQLLRRTKISGYPPIARIARLVDRAEQIAAGPRTDKQVRYLLRIAKEILEEREKFRGRFRNGIETLFRFVHNHKYSLRWARSGFAWIRFEFEYLAGVNE